MPEARRRADKGTGRSSASLSWLPSVMVVITRKGVFSRRSGTSGARGSDSGCGETRALWELLEARAGVNAASRHRPGASTVKLQDLCPNRHLQACHSLLGPIHIHGIAAKLAGPAGGLCDPDSRRKGPAARNCATVPPRLIPCRGLC